MSKPIILNPKSLGDIIDIQGLKIQLPKKPRKRDILFSDKKKVEQRWIRQEMPKLLTRENAGDYYDYIEQEFVRRREGLWFMNNGVATYITGSHYMFIQWSNIDVGYPDYRDANRMDWFNIYS
jgi:hypothetical protein